ncbi:DUF5107 domain-containing protein [Plantibacter sp. YIM 135347]|uniref:tetratricopeptide repeat protein n=1 Tax=Plantibacter sp. YIM 135347 TaxID=3423919 RepID=UPI003D34267C
MLTAESTITLPSIPASQQSRAVAAWREPLVIDSYLPEAPDRFPAFLEKRVYQGSSGQVYPMPFFERISQTKTPHAWDAIHIENEWIRLVILPELGGRIHIAYDKTNGYDFFYRNNVIKPALVGVLGPWISGGVEFNWPQHHRPATMLPTDSFIEFEDDGAVTVWCSDLDPFTRMKGMHGIRLHPDKAVVEARVRLFNRTDDTQTFLWWANVAARVDDGYQSFFPTDVHAVADHAKRAMSAFPRATGDYYGIDYPSRVSAERPDADRIDWYRNIPVPTSYMCLGTQDDFFGGYDHGRGAGFVHWADHHISPGKKQWTWGNAPFGWAWDRNLTDGDGAYVELMAGVYTDNQPDFSFLTPGETKTFSQYWFPIQGVGTVQQATLDVAVHFERLDAGSETGAQVESHAESETGRLTMSLGVVTTGVRDGVLVSIRRAADDAELWAVTADLGPGRALVETVTLDEASDEHNVALVVEHGGQVLLRWQPRRDDEAPTELPDPAREPEAPEAIASADELYLTGVHLEQFRHATRSPEPYWREALRRDPGDVRSNTALAARRYRSGRYEEARDLLETAVARATSLNPNPSDGEAHYRLGVVLHRLGRPSEAVDRLSKAAWNSAWRVPAWILLARIAATGGDRAEALRLVEQVLRLDVDHIQARGIRAVVLRALGRRTEAETQLADTLALDPLDQWSRDLAGLTLTDDPQALVDLALEYRSIGEHADALRLLDLASSVHRSTANAGRNNAAPFIEYYRSDALLALGRPADAEAARARARQVDATNALPGRLDDADVLATVIDLEPQDARALALSGHWHYAQRRYAEAIELWRRAVVLDPSDAIVWRNLGIAAFNVSGEPDETERCYRNALDAAPGDAKLQYEFDQLQKRSAVDPAVRLERLRTMPDLVAQRDDLTTEFATLLVIAGGAADRRAAVDILRSRAFQPWEGGEGVVLAAWDLAQLAIARDHLAAGEPELAIAAVQEAFDAPVSLGEARHELANCSELWLTLGDALDAAGRGAEALEAWTEAASARGDFQRMAPLAYSERTYWSVLAWRRLGREDQAAELIAGLSAHVAELEDTVPEIDYFATSLPTMLLFVEDLQQMQDVHVALLRAQLDSLAVD